MIISVKLSSKKFLKNNLGIWNVRNLLNKTFIAATYFLLPWQLTSILNIHTFICKTIIPQKFNTSLQRPKKMFFTSFSYFTLWNWNNRRKYCIIKKKNPQFSLFPFFSERRDRLIKWCIFSRVRSDKIHSLHVFPVLIILYSYIREWSLFKSREKKPHLYVTKQSSIKWKCYFTRFFFLLCSLCSFTFYHCIIFQFMQKIQQLQGKCIIITRKCVKRREKRKLKFQHLRYVLLFSCYD